MATESRRLGDRPARAPQLLSRKFHEQEASVRNLNLRPKTARTGHGRAARERRRPCLTADQEPGAHPPDGQPN